MMAVDYNQAPIIYAKQAADLFAHMLEGDMSPAERDSVQEAFDSANSVYEQTLRRTESGRYGIDPGYVYFFRLHSDRNKWNCPIKIGKSIHIPRRAAQLSIVLPWPLELVHSIQTHDMGRLERQLHHMFDDFRMEGEWFMLTQEAVEWVCQEWTYDRFQDLIDTVDEIHDL